MEWGSVWYELQRKYPALLDDETKVEFTVGNLKALLKRVHRAGKESGEHPNVSDAGSLFQDIFGGKS